MLRRVNGESSRRSFLGLALAAGAAATLSACGGAASLRSRPAASATRPWRRPVPENSRPGTRDWVIRHLGTEHEIEGYAGLASVLPGQPLPLFVSTAARGFTATAYRLGWYQ